MSLTDTEDIEVLKKRVSLLSDVIRETLWMARRYAHKRSTFAPSTVNEAVDTCLSMGLEIRDDNGGSDPFRYAEDGMLGEWDVNAGRFVGESYSK